jgi:hypothetical protein
MSVHVACLRSLKLTDGDQRRMRLVSDKQEAACISMLQPAPRLAGSWLARAVRETSQSDSEARCALILSRLPT